MKTSTTPSAPFGLLAWLGKTRIHLPLTHIETRFRITGEIAAVQIDQVFEQNAREPLDVTYTFPLPGNAAVHRCEMIVNDRVIRAVVMEEQEARRVVAEKKAAGHRTALVEMDRENLFTLQLGNVTPGDRIVIRFAYFEHLERQGALLSLRIPFSPGVRYIPGKPLLRANRGKGTEDDTDQVPDASRLTPPRISGDHPDAATLFLEGILDADEVDIRSLTSPTHPAIMRSIAKQVEVELAGEEHLPDRDFVLRWEENACTEATARAWACEHEGQSYALLQIRAPQAFAAAADDEFAQDIYFLLDRSGSMEGGKWQQCAVALHAFVRELGAQDRVWITCFESRFQDFDAELLPRDRLLADTGFQNLASIGTGGGTELLPALEHVLGVRQRLGTERPARLILITDGQVGNESEILTRMTAADAAGLPVHCFGIDDAVNDAFLNSLARQTGGRCALLTPQDDIPAAVHRLGETLRRPVLLDFQIEDGHLTSNNSLRLADLHAGEVSLLALRCAAGKNSARITARQPDGTAWTQNFTWQPDAGSQTPRLLWAHRRSRHLLSANRDAEAIRLAIEHNITCKGTSFVAWDEVEKVSVAKREVYQPVMGTPRYSLSAPALAAPPSGLAALVSPSSTATFCESKITDYQKASMLMECSDDDLVSDVPDVLQKPAVRFRARLAYSESAFSPRLRRWEHQFHSCLKSAGMELQKAVMLSNLLRTWACEVISRGREALLLALLETLKASATPLDELRQFILAHVTGRPLEDLRRVMPEFLEKSPAPHAS